MIPVINCETCLVSLNKPNLELQGPVERRFVSITVRVGRSSRNLEIIKVNGNNLEKKSVSE